MSQVRVHNFSISLDGFGTGDGITSDAPFGHAGERLHEWMFATRFWRSMVGLPGGTLGLDHSFAERHGPGIGAEIMGRGKFGVQTGPWTDVGADDEWRGWWGPNPPFHTPVFVLTRQKREPWVRKGGTTFYFVNDGIENALARAREVAGGKDIRIAGGANVIGSYLHAGLVDEIHVALAPVFLGSGTRLFERLDDAGLKLEIVRTTPSDAVTHLHYAVSRRARPGS